jgi:hypothetical protein
MADRRQKPQDEKPKDQPGDRPPTAEELEERTETMLKRRIPFT